MPDAVSPPTRPHGLLLAAAVAAWFGLWYLTPGLHGNGVGSLVTDDAAVRVSLESIAALTIAVGLVGAHRRFNSTLFAVSPALWIYTVPVVAALALPLHYGMGLPIGIYMFWMTVSVFWQDYLTFGLLQSYLAQRLRPWAVLSVSAVVFWAGHALLLPDTFAPANPLPSVAILALGFALGGMRLWLGSLHVLLAAHLTFYYVFA